MNNLELVKEMLKHIGDHTIEQDKIIAKGCVMLLDYVEVVGTAQRTELKAEPKKKAAAPKKETKTAKRGLDHGKICALYKANWSIKAIADEMDSNDATIRYHLKKEGLIK